MTRTIWLASYPKSGNTWFRILLANLDCAEGETVDINALESGGGIASGRGAFDHWLLIESGLLTHDEIDALRPRVYELQALAGEEDDDDGGEKAAEGLRMVKVHDAYLDTPKGEPLLGGAKGANGAIAIVRDPRDVAPSLANHMHTTIDAAIDFMGDANATFCGGSKGQANQLRQKLPTWSGHVASWIDQTDIPVHLVRYEDLQADPIKTFGEALAFAGREVDLERVARAVDAAAFSKVKAQETEKGFREAPRAGTERSFFRRGQTGAWRDELTVEQVSRIEQAHAPMMARLGYKLSTEDWARTG